METTGEPIEEKIVGAEDHKARFGAIVDACGDEMVDCMHDMEKIIQDQKLFLEFVLDHQSEYKSDECITEIENYNLKIYQMWKNCREECKKINGLIVWEAVDEEMKQVV